MFDYQSARFPQVDAPRFATYKIGQYTFLVFDYKKVLVFDYQTARCPQVDAPRFATYKIGQYTTRPDVDNYVCVTLKTNYLFKSDSTAEVSSTPTPSTNTFNLSNPRQLQPLKA